MATLESFTRRGGNLSYIWYFFFFSTFVEGNLVVHGRFFAQNIPYRLVSRLPFVFGSFFDFLYVPFFANSTAHAQSSAHTHTCTQFVFSSLPRSMRFWMYVYYMQCGIYAYSECVCISSEQSNRYSYEETFIVSNLYYTYELTMALGGWTLSMGIGHACISCRLYVLTVCMCSVLYIAFRPYTKLAEEGGWGKFLFLLSMRWMCVCVCVGIISLAASPVLE